MGRFEACCQRAGAESGKHRADASTYRKRERELRGGAARSAGRGREEGGGEMWRRVAAESEGEDEDE